MSSTSAKLMDARRSIYSSPNKSVDLSFDAVETAVTIYIKRCNLSNEEIKKLRNHISTNGLKGWKLFWDNLSTQSRKQIPGELTDYEGPQIRPLLNAYLITIGKSDLSPYLARYDYSDRKVSQSLAEEAWISAEYLIELIENI